MKPEFKRKFITAIVAIIIFGIAAIFTDGKIDSNLDWLALLWPAGILWIYGRITGVL